MEDKQQEKKPAKYINVFGDWVKSIPVGDYNRIRHQVISDCKITNQIFMHWKCGNSKVPILAHEKINQIAGSEVFKTESK